MKIALIGLGDIAVKAHLPVLSQISEVGAVHPKRRDVNATRGKISDLRILYRLP